MSTGYLSLPMKKPLLSLILKLEGLLSDDQLEKALREWKIRRDEGRYTAFGELVLKLGYIKLRDLRGALSLQRKLAAAPQPRQPLGMLVLQNGLVKPTQLLWALQQQSASGRRLGEILLEWGYLNRRQIEILLRFQGNTPAAP